MRPGFRKDHALLLALLLTNVAGQIAWLLPGTTRVLQGNSAVIGTAVLPLRHKMSFEMSGVSMPSCGTSMNFINIVVTSPSSVSSQWPQIAGSCGYIQIQWQATGENWPWSAGTATWTKSGTNFFPSTGWKLVEIWTDLVDGHVALAGDGTIFAQAPRTKPSALTGNYTVEIREGSGLNGGGASIRNIKFEALSTLPNGWSLSTTCGAGTATLSPDNVVACPLYSAPPTALPSRFPTANPSPVPTARPTGTLLQTAEGSALCDFYNGLTANAGKSSLANWCVGAAPYSPCGSGTSTWTGVTCGTVGGLSRVVNLDVGSKGLVGTVPASVGSLGSLTRLALWVNSLSGPLPTELWTLTNLQQLLLMHNKFTGSLPTTVGNLAALTYLHLATNSFSSSLPTQLGVLTKLLTLMLSNNQFTGSLPTTVGNLASLSDFTLGVNSLSGSLPSQLGVLTKLVNFLFQNNRFTSAVPASFCSFGTSINLQLQSNSGLTCLPSCLTTGSYTNLQKDATLTAVCSSAPSPNPTAISAAPTAIPSAVPGTLSTPQPSSVPTASPTTKSDTPSPVPTARPTGTLLQTAEGAALCDFYNGLTANAGKGSLANWCVGSAPYSPCGSGTSTWTGVTCGTVKGASRVVQLSLYQKGLAGTVPSTFGSLGSLTTLLLFRNSFAGSLPTELGLLTGLQMLNLHQNFFTGLPTQLGLMTGLWYFDLQNNRLVTLPTEIGLLKGLQYLALNMNSLVGSLPTQLGLLTGLQGLHLSDNGLAGSLPTELGLLTGMQNLFLDSNSLVGSIPTELGLLTGLQYLYLNSNSLVGSLPTELGLLKALQQLTLYSNSFNGAVPSSLCSLSTSISLNLNSNPSLTCLPSCLTTGGYSNLQKDATLTAVCNSPTASPSALPTPQPSTVPTARPTMLPGLPTAVPTLAPSCVPTTSPTLLPTAPSPLPSSSPTTFPTPQPSTVPTATPSSAPTPPPSPQPSAGPTVIPTPTPTLQPSAKPTWQVGSIITRTVTSSIVTNSQGSGFGYSLETQQFSNLVSLASGQWTLQVEVWATGWGSDFNYAQLSLQGGVDGTAVTLVKCYTGAGDSCEPNSAGPGYVYNPGAATVRCVVNLAITPAMLSPANGGSLSIAASTKGFTNTKCQYQGNDVVLRYTLVAGLSVPTSVPTLAPTARPSPTLPTTPYPSAQPTLFPTAPTPQPSAQPTLPPTAAPSALPTSRPSPIPTAAPSRQPTPNPSSAPTAHPTTATPTAHPTSTNPPSAVPSARPTPRPTSLPTKSPTPAPSKQPTPAPSVQPTPVPTPVPSAYPTDQRGAIVIPTVITQKGREEEKSLVTNVTLDTSSGGDWFLSVDVMMTGWKNPDAQLYVRITKSVSDGSSSSSRRRLNEFVYVNSGDCNPGTACGSIDKRCVSNYNIPAAALARTGGLVMLQLLVEGLSYKVACPAGKDKNEQVRAFYIFTQTAFPTPMPTPAASNSSVGQLGDSTDGAVATTTQKSLPFYAVAGAAGIFAALAFLMLGIRDQRDTDERLMKMKMEGGRVQELKQLPVLLGSALLGSAFVSECFLIHLLLTSTSFQLYGIVSLGGRALHVFVALFLYTRIVSATPKYQGLYWMKNVTLFSKKSKEYSLLALFTLTDVTLVRFFPWLETTHTRNTAGFPSPTVFRACVYTKLTQGALSVAVQLLYLVHLQDGSSQSPSIRQRNTSVVYLNISVTILVFFVNILEAVSRAGSIDAWLKEDEERGVLAASRESKAPSEGNRASGRIASGRIELGAIKEPAASAISSTNPMHAAHSGGPSSSSSSSSFAEIHVSSDDEAVYLGRLSMERSTLGGGQGGQGSSPLGLQPGLGSTAAPRLSLVPSATVGAASAPASAPAPAPALAPKPRERTPSMMSTRDSIPSMLALAPPTNAPPQGSRLHFSPPPLRPPHSLAPLANHPGGGKSGQNMPRPPAPPARRPGP